MTDPGGEDALRRLIAGAGEETPPAPGLPPPPALPQGDVRQLLWQQQQQQQRMNSHAVPGLVASTPIDPLFANINNANLSSSLPNAAGVDPQQLLLGTTTGAGSISHSMNPMAGATMPHQLQQHLQQSSPNPSGSSSMHLYQNPSHWQQTELLQQQQLLFMQQQQQQNALLQLQQQQHRVMIQHQQRQQALMQQMNGTPPIPMSAVGTGMSLGSSQQQPTQQSIRQQSMQQLDRKPESLSPQQQLKSQLPPELLQQMMVSQASSTRASSAMPPATMQQSLDHKASSHSHSSDKASKSASQQPLPELTFGQKIYRLLMDAEKEGQDHVVSFTPSGHAFRIHDRQAFMDDIVPRYFRMNKFSSFKRQLYLYDFETVQDGADEGGYMHEWLHKGHEADAVKIRRVKGGYVVRNVSSSTT